MAVRLSAICAGHPLPLQEDSWYSFLLEAGRPQGHSAAGRTRSIEKIHLFRKFNLNTLVIDFFFFQNIKVDFEITFLLTSFLNVSRLLYRLR
jgi:hypothetical protein